MMIGYNFILQFRQLIFFIRDTHRLQESSKNIRIKQKSEVTKRGRGREKENWSSDNWSFDNWSF